MESKLIEPIPNPHVTKYLSRPLRRVRFLRAFAAKAVFDDGHRGGVVVGFV